MGCMRQYISDSGQLPNVIFISGNMICNIQEKNRTCKMNCISG